MRTTQDWLSEACALLAVEARDHEENRQYDGHEQRKRIAEILRRFIAQAEKQLVN